MTLRIESYKIEKKLQKKIEEKSKSTDRDNLKSNCCVPKYHSLGHHTNQSMLVN